jgi:hypothetical protein
MRFNLIVASFLQLSGVIILNFGVLFFVGLKVSSSYLKKDKSCFRLANNNSLFICLVLCLRAVSTSRIMVLMKVEVI